MPVTEIEYLRNSTTELSWVRLDWVYDHAKNWIVTHFFKVMSREHSGFGSGFDSGPVCADRDPPGPL